MDVGAHYCATLDEIRTVWAAVSAQPTISLRCLVDVTGIKKTRVRYILYFLERAGYLAHKAHHTGRQVLIPLVWT